MKKLLFTLFALGTVAYANAQAQPPNPGMEAWSSVFTEPQDPTNWISANVFYVYSSTNPTSVFQAPTPNNYQGTYSAKITTVKLASNPAPGNIPDTIGYLLNGTVGFSSPYLKPGSPYVSRPQTLTFAAKYTPAVAGDSAYVDVALTKWNGSSRTTIASNHQGIITSATYIVQNVSINYQSATLFPDTMIITFNSSGGLHNHHLGSALWVDALAFSGTNGIEEYTNAVGFSTFPNPAVSEMTILTEAKKVSFVNVYDMTGRQIEVIKVTGDHTTVNTESYNKGMYIYQAMNSEGAIMARGKFNVVR
jgi:hypothetical protein